MPAIRSSCAENSRRTSVGIDPSQRQTVARLSARRAGTTPADRPGSALPGPTAAAGPHRPRRDERRTRGVGTSRAKRHGEVEGPGDRQDRRRGHDAFAVSAHDRPAHSVGEPEVVGVDDEQAVAVTVLGSGRTLAQLLPQAAHLTEHRADHRHRRQRGDTPAAREIVDADLDDVETQAAGPGHQLGVDERSLADQLDLRR